MRELLYLHDYKTYLPQIDLRGLIYVSTLYLQSQLNAFKV